MTEVFSPYMLKTYEKCPKSYYFKFVKGIQMPVDDDIFAFGKNIHAIASYYLRGENIDNMEMALSSKELEVWNYLKNIEYFKYETVNTEYSLMVKVGDNFFGGRLDALVKKDGRYYILDYKTGSIPRNPAYDYQTMIYLLGVSKLYGTDRVTFIYLDLKHKLETKIDLNEIFIKEYEEKLLNISGKISKEIFSASKKECNTCEFRKICYE